jgi:hypothetical protein
VALSGAEDAKGWKLNYCQCDSKLLGMVGEAWEVTIRDRKCRENRWREGMTLESRWGGQIE